jgi:benzoate/toluate 1,2-dioxygenase alpha subunit
MQMRHKLAALVEESDARFRVDRAVYFDPEVFEAEVAAFFEGGWVYLCHESQLRSPGDYFSTQMGRQPVFVTRRKDGSLGAYINACAHRGATLVPLQSGHVSAFTCRFHGWVFGLDGRCIKIKNQDTGGYLDADCRAQFSLTPVARLESYRGFVFGSLRADVPSLTGYLAGTKPWIDLMVDQSLQGLEVLPGSSTYVIQGNWKMQAENGVDGYHVSTVHRVFANTMANREAKLGLTGMQRTESGRLTGNVASAGYDFGNGHMAIWAQHTEPSRRPIYEQKERLERDLTPDQVDWILNRGRNLYLFPNVLLMDNPSTQIRTIQPISPDRAEVTVRCVAPIGESQAARSARLRKFEDFYLTTGMATSDDLAALEATHLGGYGRAARWNDLARGGAGFLRGAENKDAARIGCVPQTSSENWDHEAIYRGFYRNWKQRLLDADVTT